MIFGIITLLVALSISGIAAYFSIIGLAALFAASFWPVVMMGSVLEIGKLSAVAWLHRNWEDKKIPKLLKYYLVMAVLVLMLITSMGIFGFLSKGHLEQDAPVRVLTSEMERNNLTIANNQELIANLREQRNNELSSTQSNQNIRLQSLVSAQEALIEQYQSQIDNIDQRIALQNQEIERNRESLAVLEQGIQSLIEQEFVIRSQQLRDEQGPEREQIAQNISLAQEQIRSYQDEKAELQRQISQARQEISNILNNSVTSNNQERTTDYSSQIQALEEEIRELNSRNLDIEFELGETTAKLGPIQYVAGLFGLEDAEAAVRIVIFMIMFAFDPVAVALLIAAQWSWMRYADEHESEKKKKAKVETKERELNKRINSLKEEKEKLEQLSSNYEKRINELLHNNEVTITQKQKEIDKLNQKIEQIYKDVEDADNALQEEITEHRAEIKTLKEENAKLHKTNHSLLIEKTKIETDRDNLQRQIDEIYEAVENN